MKNKMKITESFFCGKTFIATSLLTVIIKTKNFPKLKPYRCIIQFHQE